MLIGKSQDDLEGVLFDLIAARDDARAHAEKLAGQLAECVGIMSAVNLDRRHRDMHGNLFLNQTLDWGKGCAAIAAQSNLLLEEHDDFMANRPEISPED